MNNESNKEILFKNKIFLGDNLTLFKKIPNNNIDLIFADPPYNMQLSKELLRYGGEKFNGVNDEWDKYDSLIEYDKYAKKWLQECLRTLKPNGSLWVIGSFQNIHRLGYILQDLGAWIISEVVWEKTNPVPNFSGSRLVNAQETLLWVTKNAQAKFTFNYKTMKHINNGKQMKSIWRFPSAIGKERLKDKIGNKIHSTQKPLALLERIILCSSNYNDIVLDPFSGTGTTAHAAKRLGRQYIGFEKEEKYFNASLERLKKVDETNDVFLKHAIFDRKPPKVTFKHLIEKEYLKIGQEVNIKGIIYHFNKNGELVNNNYAYSPNKLLKMIFKKPVNSWTYLEIDGVKLAKIRNDFRKQELKWENENSYL